MFTNRQAIFLGISKEENKVLACIKNIPKNIFTIHEDTKIPRSTIYLIIQKLYNRDFIRAKMQGKRYLYKTINSKEVKYKFQEILAFI